MWTWWNEANKAAGRSSKRPATPNVPSGFLRGQRQAAGLGEQTRSPLNGAIELIYKGSCQCPLLCEIDVFFLPKLWSTQLVFWGTKESTPRMYIHYFQTLINWNPIRTFEGFFSPSL